MEITKKLNEITAVDAAGNEYKITKHLETEEVFKLKLDDGTPVYSAKEGEFYIVQDGEEILLTQTS